MATNLTTAESAQVGTPPIEDNEGDNGDRSYTPYRDSIMDNELADNEVNDGNDEEDNDDDNDDENDDDYSGDSIDGSDDLDVEFEVQESDEIEGDDDDAQQQPRVLELRGTDGLRRLFRLIGGGNGLRGHAEDAFADLFNGRSTRRRREPPDPDRFPKVPSDTGRELMDSGTFGSNGMEQEGSLAMNRQPHCRTLARRILARELGSDLDIEKRINQRLMAQEMLPGTAADMIVHYDLPCYSGQFSDDGNFFFSVNKDFRVRMYDTSNPWHWRYYKTVNYLHGRWTLTDASLSPDNKYLAYTSISPIVALAPTDPSDLGDPYTLDLSDRGRGNGPNSIPVDRFGIWSIRFSGDGRRLVAGTIKGGIVVYDIESRRVLHHIFGHDDDVNAVCFADSSSPHILYSGSDDSFVKVWDTRSMGDNREVGAFVGHIEGITYIDSKGDGRYVLSNGKDQSMKLWDLRKVIAPGAFNALSFDQRPRGAFDYRWGNFDDSDFYTDKNDNSVVTFRGHRVLRTLIRCHFSPPNSTNSRYVYSGSADGKVYVWNMDATIAGVIDVHAATKNSRPVDAAFDLNGGWGDDDDDGGLPTRWKTCVRDASWHPNAPLIAASALNGYGSSTGTVTTHSWNNAVVDDEAEPEMGMRLNPKLEHDPSFYYSADSNHQSTPRRGLFGRQ